MVALVKRIFLDPSRCIGCRSCVAACRECDTHKGESMIYIDFVERHNTVASSPTLCMHCEDPLAPCAQVCPAQAILVSPDGVVQSADETRCIYCENCGYACPFGVPKFNIAGHYMQKCNLCYDRTSQGKGPMCATVCPTQAIFYGTYEEWLAAGRGKQGAKPVNTFFFGRQKLRSRNYVVMREEDEELDILALVDAVDRSTEIPRALPVQDAEQWVDAETAGIPQRVVPPQPWTPREPNKQPVPTGDANQQERISVVSVNINV
ncbi:MAG TPA: 4Fe-4S dicluster domain-containing protein [Ktedonobacteraceae bacterium]|nr:4Fe-4S dicluster domain-containing protein [Ktedonobacteraceae bacterium]